MENSDDESRKLDIDTNVSSLDSLMEPVHEQTKSEKLYFSKNLLKVMLTTSLFSVRSSSEKDE